MFCFYQSVPYFVKYTSFTHHQWPGNGCLWSQTIRTPIVRKTCLSQSEIHTSSCSFMVITCGVHSCHKHQFCSLCHINSVRCNNCSSYTCIRYPPQCRCCSLILAVINCYALLCSVLTTPYFHWESSPWSWSLCYRCTSVHRTSSAPAWGLSSLQSPGLPFPAFCAKWYDQLIVVPSNTTLYSLCCCGYETNSSQPIDICLSLCHPELPGFICDISMWRVVNFHNHARVGLNLDWAVVKLWTNKY